MLKKSAILFFLLLFCFNSNASQMELIWDKTYQTPLDYWQINTLSSEGNVETEIAIEFGLPDYTEVVFEFNASEGIPHGMSVISEVKVCKGYMQSMSLDIDINCESTVNYVTEFAGLQSTYRPTRKVFNTYDSRKLRFQGGNSHYVIYLKYSTEKFPMKKGFRQFVRFDPACHLYNLCPPDNRIWQMIVFPGKNYDFEGISPTPNEISMRTEDEAWVLQFRSSEPLWVTYVNTDEVYWWTVTIPAIVGIIFGAFAEWILSKIRLRKQKNDKINLPKGIGPKTLKKLDRAKLEIIKK